MIELTIHEWICTAIINLDSLGEFQGILDLLYKKKTSQVTKAIDIYFFDRFERWWLRDFERVRDRLDQINKQIIEPKNNSKSNTCETIVGVVDGCSSIVTVCNTSIDCESSISSVSIVVIDVARWFVPFWHLTISPLNSDSNLRPMESTRFSVSERVTQLFVCVLLVYRERSSRERIHWHDRDVLLVYAFFRENQAMAVVDRWIPRCHLIEWNFNENILSNYWAKLLDGVDDDSPSDWNSSSDLPIELLSLVDFKTSLILSSWHAGCSSIGSRFGQMSSVFFRWFSC